MGYAHIMNYIIVSDVMNMSESVLIKCDTEYYCRLSDCIIIPTAMTEINWYVCMHVSVCPLRCTNATAPFFCEDSLISAVVK